MDPFPILDSESYKSLRPKIRSGDILLCSGNSLFSKMIQQATQSMWSHVAFILRIESIDRVMVLESVESIGVRSVPLSNYINDYNATGKCYPGRILLARHDGVKQDNIANLSDTAINLLGYPYGTEEIIRIAARIGMSSVGFNDGSVDLPYRKEFICSEYAYVCFQSIGVNIDYDSRGFISPVDFARSKQVQALSYIKTCDFSSVPELVTA